MNKSKWSYLGLIIIAILTLAIVGCTKEKPTNKTTESQKNKVVLFEKMSASNRAKIAFKFTAKAAKVQQESGLDESVEVTVGMMIINNSPRTLKFNLAKVEPDTYEDNVKQDGQADYIKIKPGQTYQQKKLFKTSYFNFTDPVAYSYYVSNKKKIKLVDAVTLVNKSAAENWQKEIIQAAASKNNNQASSTASQEQSNGTSTAINPTNLTNEQLIEWVGNLTASHVDSKFSKVDFNYAISVDNDQKLITVTENHDSAAMKAAGADPKTAPTVAVLFVNAQGQLQDKYIGTIWAEKYTE